MKKIGFHNFRRFIDFPVIEYGPITFLVGRNNSGKSTLVKALLLLDDFLKRDNIRDFSFTSSNVEDVNIVTYDRAKNRFATQDFIRFEFQTESINIELTVSGQEDKTSVDVNSLQISDLSSGFTFLIDPKGQIIFSSKNVRNVDVEDNNKELLEELKQRQKALKEQLKKLLGLPVQEYVVLNEELNALKGKISSVNKLVKKNKVLSEEFSLNTEFTRSSLKEIFEEMIFEFSSEYELQYHDIQRGKKPKKDFENLRAFKDIRFRVERSVKTLLSNTRNANIVYLGATLNKQSALFAIRDKNNALAQSIHEYKQLGISKGEEAHRFVLKWMNSTEFEIGDDFDILMHAGEAYELVVHSNNTSIPLADKGMGSIQAMLLILRIATIIHKKQLDKRKYVIVIEEPEINLHPALQSKLANLFHDVYLNNGIELIIETHSEYLIRKTQLIVKNFQYEVKPNENPFCVIYFDKDMKQWHMNYREDGRFIDNFGKGFYDESALLTLDLF